MTKANKITEIITEFITILIMLVIGAMTILFLSIISISNRGNEPQKRGSKELDAYIKTINTGTEERKIYESVFLENPPNLVRLRACADDN